MIDSAEKVVVLLKKDKIAELPCFLKNNSKVIYTDAEDPYNNTDIPEALLERFRNSRDQIKSIILTDLLM